MAPNVIKKSARLKTNNELVPILKCKQSVTEPKKSLSIKLPKPPERTNVRPIFCILSTVVKKVYTKNIKAINIVIVRKI